MPDQASRFRKASGPGTPLSRDTISGISVLALGLSLSAFLGITFVLCVLFDLWFPDLAMNPVWTPLLPGFSWLTWPSFFLGLAESVGYGWYIALIFGPLYNFCTARFG